jgi:hypothetical protein
LSNINKDSFESIYKDKMDYNNNIRAEPNRKIIYSGDDID